MHLLTWTLVLIIGSFLEYWILLFISSLFVDPKKIYEKHSGYYRWLLVSSTWHLIFVGRVRFHTKGMEKIPKDQRFLLVCNHRSKLDPITTWYLLQDYDLAFISKEENFHVPCWGRLIRRCCFLAIDCENPRKAMVRSTAQQILSRTTRSQSRSILKERGISAKDSCPSTTAYSRSPRRQMFR